MISKTTKRYSDFDLSFNMHPNTKDLSTKINEEAVKQSVKNLILTNLYERPFHPEIGSNVTASLFDNAIIAKDSIKDKIVRTIENYEPRVTIQSITVSEKIDENSLDVSIIFSVINSDKPQRFSFPLSLDRTR